MTTPGGQKCTGRSEDILSFPCEVNPEFWFSKRSTEIREAKEACGHCPVRPECAELGQDEEFGIWGGLGPDDRAAEKRLQLISLEAMINSRIRIMQAEGMSISAMARELDMPRTTLVRRLRRATGLAA
ncbi:WhiB family transcriptional regulator [Streptomyces antimicrobicus]|uniref:WhiB family transcriptional regulator n=1 Tax=Streptomyces antimicrobicus TaxID=2883108 RepID=A0ABS8B4L8_9ACTN|nr:WhiB family transcriptional regulator [Streptomyces antimicrobicus]MCB5179543.1 WhiB family transcriptional regulator [Streptomyces antimicrobicus]